MRIALVGKYVQLQDAYLSVVEALRHAAIHHGRQLEVIWVDAETLRKEEITSQLQSADGILVPGGFGIRGIEGKIMSACYARENKVPYLGLCLGLQVAVAEFARHVAGMVGANSSEFDPSTNYPVIDLLPEQKDVADMGGTMRLGASPTKLVAGTRASEAYGEAVIYERHRHRYEVNNIFRSLLQDTRTGDQRHDAGRASGRGHRTAGPPLVRGLPVSPRVQEPSHSAPSAVQGICGRGHRVRLRVADAPSPLKSATTTSKARDEPSTHSLS